MKIMKIFGKYHKPLQRSEIDEEILLWKIIFRRKTLQNSLRKISDLLAFSFSLRKPKKKKTKRGKIVC